ncbi:MAG: universal stress protein [Eggerthellaceae bacterium]|jgi:nucleotide-binding universal stress UspA family protein
MLYKKILVPFDHSEQAQHALKHALALIADDPSAEVVVFRSIAGAKDVDALVGRGKEGTTYVDEDTRVRFKKMRDKQKGQAMEDLKDDANPFVKDAKNPVTYVAEFYPTAVQGTLETLENTGADCIVMGCRGMNAVAGMLGSVSYGVVRSASVPVVTVK